MDRPAVLAAIRELAAAGAITEAELVQAFQDGADADRHEATQRQTRLSRALSFLGGGVIVIGISAFISQVWHELGTVLRILVTLGSGLAAYVAGVLLSWSRRVGAAGMAFFLVAALVLPVGMVVTLDETGLDPERLGMQTLICAILAVVFLVTHLLFTGNSLLVYTIIYGTLTFFGLTSTMAGANPRFHEPEFLWYRLLVVGLAYMVLAFAFSGTRRAGLSGALYGFGSLGFLTAAFGLGGWQPSQNVLWELLFPGLAFAIVYASVHLRSKVLLTFGSSFIAIYLMKLTAEYFADSLGWPLSLVLAGLLLIAIGTLTLRLKRRYLGDASTPAPGNS